MSKDYKYGFDADSVTELKNSVEQLYDGIDGYIKANIGNVKADIAEVWTGEDEKVFEESFDSDINALYQQVLKLRDEISENISNIQTSWETTQTDNAQAMTSLKRY